MLRTGFGQPTLAIGNSPAPRSRRLFLTGSMSLTRLFAEPLRTASVYSVNDSSCLLMARTSARAGRSPGYRKPLPSWSLQKILICKTAAAGPTIYIKDHRFP
ncbi:hypothetical protein MN608_07288 [Microdochium nivale]|nr:hypothetical protein MN608_07288 [Microdochium nivale]